MKILLLADASSIHTIRWANSLSEQNTKIILFTLSSYNQANYNSQIEIKSLLFFKRIKNMSDGNFFKIGYLLSTFSILKLYKNFKPDLVHAYYASSYGLLATLLNLKPLIISAWGSDIYEFPTKNYINYYLLKFVLKRANLILSTSDVMAQKISTYTENQNIKVVPFGINTTKFSPEIKNVKNLDVIKIGTIKSLEDTYGIDILLKAFSIIKSRNSNKNIRLVIVGSGSKAHKLQNLAEKLDLSESTDFVGFVNHSIIQDFHKELDIAVYLSRRESFGVSILESSSCGIPIVATQVDGIVEVVRDKFSGFLVAPNDPNDAAEKIQILIDDEKLRIKLGQNGRNFVIQNFSWNKSVELTLNIYQSILKKSQC